MKDLIEERFFHLMDEDKLAFWWMCEDRWEDYAKQMISEGYDPIEVKKYFSELREDL